MTSDEGASGVTPRCLYRQRDLPPPHLGIFLLRVRESCVRRNVGEIQVTREKHFFGAFIPKQT